MGCNYAIATQDTCVVYRGSNSMKKFMLWNILIILSVAFAMNTASAALEITESFNKDTPTFGDDGQEASNPEHDESEKHDIFDTVTLKVKNTDTTAVTVDTIEVSTASGFKTSDLQFTIVGDSVSIPASSTKDVQLKARIPEQLDAVDDTTFEKQALIVATIKLKDSSSTTAISADLQVFMQRENQLEISDSDAIINGKGKQSIDDDDNLENIVPGDRIEIEVEASNEFDDRTNLDINDVDLEISCDEEDNFDFDDKTEEIGDIGTEDEETESINFDVEEDAKDETSNCELSVSGEDENGALHGEMISFDVEVERKNHDLLIKSINANPTSLSCDDTTINLRVDFINLGRSNEDRVAIEVTSKLFGYQERIAGFELDEDDRDEKTFLVPVSPRELKQGPSVFQIQTFYDNNKLSDTATYTVDNLCSEGALASNGKKTKTPTTTRNALVISSEKINLAKDSLASLAVKVVNKEDATVEYIVSLENTEDFAETASSKKVFLNAGQESTVFLNLKSKENVAAGMYSGSVVLKDNKGNTLETRSFTVEAAGKTSGKNGGFNLFGGDSDSKVFWIIGDIILIIVAIFFIKLIFTGGRGRKAAKAKRMADYEASATKKRK